MFINNVIIVEKKFEIDNKYIYIFIGVIIFIFIIFVGIVVVILVIRKKDNVRKNNKFSFGFLGVFM